ncbi:hypothetical protein GCM10027048_44670 [Hymenobacter coalescens]
MTTSSISLRRLNAGLLLAMLSLTLGSCGWLRDDDQQPQLRMTNEQAAWADPYRNSATWTFRGPGAQALSMQVIKFDDQNKPQTKFSSKTGSIDFYRQEIHTGLSGPAGGAAFELHAEVSLDNMFEPFSARLQLNNAYFNLPAAALEAGRPLPPGGTVTLLPQFSLGGRTYQNALEMQPYTLSNDGRPEAIRRIVYHKAGGVLQYQTANGELWNRVLP